LVFGPRVDWEIPDKDHAEAAYFNRQGFRTRETIGAKGEDEFRIIALGGSTTEDAWNEAGIHWPLVLERELHAAGHRHVRVLNAGMSAYSSAHSLVQYEFHIVEFDPDLLLVMHNINDLDVTYFAARLGEPIDSNYAAKYSQRGFTGDVDDDDVVISRLAHSIAAHLAELRAPGPTPLPDYDLREGLRLFHRNLRNLILLARSNGTDVVLLTMPVDRSRDFDPIRLQGTHYGSPPTREQFLADFERFNREARRVADSEQVALVDMAALMPQEPSYFADSVHYTTAGTEAFGKLLAADPAFRSLLPVPRPTGPPNLQR
jgi:lysophospholipase L1-like esterase